MTPDIVSEFEELHESCRLWDAAKEMWLVPVPILHFIIDKFPKAELVGELKHMVMWTPTRLLL